MGNTEYAVVDYSDTDYYEIQEVISEHQYTLPVISYTKEGYQTILTEDWSETSYMSQPVRIHYYRLTTYLPNNQIQEDYFGAEGLHSCRVYTAE